jgi:hypothetical protein
MFTRAPRLLSNKENSTFPLSPSQGFTSSSASKPRISGIGRAPHKRSHGVKPYARVPSVQRAKAAAAGVKKPTKTKPVLAPIIVPKAAATPRVVQPAKIAKIPLRLPRPVIPPVTTTLPSLDHVVSPSLIGAGSSANSPGLTHTATRVRRCSTGAPAVSAPPRLIALPTLPPTQFGCALADNHDPDQRYRPKPNDSTLADHGVRYPTAR